MRRRRAITLLFCSHDLQPCCRSCSERMARVVAASRLSRPPTYLLTCDPDLSGVLPCSGSWCSVPVAPSCVCRVPDCQCAGALEFASPTQVNNTE